MAKKDINRLLEAEPSVFLLLGSKNRSLLLAYTDRVCNAQNVLGTIGAQLLPMASYFRISLRARLFFERAFEQAFSMHVNAP